MAVSPLHSSLQEGGTMACLRFEADDRLGADDVAVVEVAARELLDDLPGEWSQMKVKCRKHDDGTSPLWVRRRASDDGLPEDFLPLRQV